MAQEIIIPIADDNDVPTNFYEIFYRIVGNANYTRQVFNHPLPDFTTVSPAGSTPCIVLSPLPDGTDYEFKVRRYDMSNNFSDWVDGVFTTGPIIP